MDSLSQRLVQLVSIHCFHVKKAAVWSLGREKMEHFSLLLLIFPAELGDGTQIYTRDKPDEHLLHPSSLFIKHPLHAHITIYILWREGTSLSLCLVFKLPMQIKRRKLNIKLQCVLLLFPSFLLLPSVQIEQLHSGGRNRSWLPDRLCNLSVHYDHTKWEQCSPSVFQHESPCIGLQHPLSSVSPSKKMIKYQAPVGVKNNK